MAMLLACAAVLEHAGFNDDRYAAAASALRAATLNAALEGVRTFDLGGESSTSDVVDDVIRRMRERDA
jgi:isocitrate/isopropylmalate dehydrogenase